MAGRLLKRMSMAFSAKVNLYPGLEACDIHFGNISAPTESATFNAFQGGRERNGNKVGTHTESIGRNLFNALRDNHFRKACTMTEAVHSPHARRNLYGSKRLAILEGTRLNDSDGRRQFYGFQLLPIKEQAAAYSRQTGKILEFVKTFIILINPKDPDKRSNRGRLNL